MERKAIIEAVKEVLRLALFAALAAAAGWGAEWVAGFDPNSTYYIVGTFVLRFVDKWVHENQNTDLNGISPF